jgi:hypothetical protein
MSTHTARPGVSLDALWCTTHELTNCAYCGARNEHERNREAFVAMFGGEAEVIAPQRTFAVVPVPTSRPLPPRAPASWAASTHQLPRAPLSAWHVLKDPVERGGVIVTQQELHHG